MDISFKHFNNLVKHKTEDELYNLEHKNKIKNNDKFSL